MKRGGNKRGIDPGAHGARRHIRTGLVLSAIQILGLILSVGQDAISAKLFGARVEMDVYLEAWIVPVVLANVVGPAMQNALVPHFAVALAEGGADSAWEMASDALMVTVGFFCAVAVLGLALSHQILGFVAAGAPPEAAPMLLRIYAIGYGFAMLSLVGSLLNGLCSATGRFIFPALLTNLSALVPVVGLLLLGRRIGVTALPVSLAGGALLQTGCLFWTVAELGLRFPKFRPGILRRIGPLLRDSVLVGLAIVPLGLIPVAERHFGSRLAEGSIAQLNYASKFVAAAMRVFASALGAMGLPLLSAYLARGERARFERVFGLLFKLGCYASVVGAVGLTFAGPPLVQLVLQRGRFTASDSALVASCLGRSAWYLIYGIVFPVLSAALLSGRRAWILPIANLIGLLVYLAVAVLTNIPGGGPLGLAAAYAIGCDAIVVPAYFLLWRVRLITLQPLLGALWRSAVLAPIVYVCLFVCVRAFSRFSVGPAPVVLIFAIVGGGVSLLAISLLDKEVRAQIIEAIRAPETPSSALSPRQPDFLRG